VRAARQSDASESVATLDDGDDDVDDDDEDIHDEDDDAAISKRLFSLGLYNYIYMYSIILIAR
jgi:hypothetical protein